MEVNVKGNNIVLKDNSTTGELILVCQFDTRLDRQTQLGST